MLFATMQRRFQVLWLVLALMAIAPPAGLAAGQDPAARPPAGYEEALGRAAAALKQGDHAAGLVSLDAALRIHPEGFEAFMLLGQAYMKLERYAEASSAFR
ncbi:MAG TPA: tetratricopeptide repeat protein, partial [Candidatus Polarisedimenticolia bacterium]|nr:tetratricopeptide repeat protein [Candidatus Polarisedimenticolia bacterium]